MDNRNEFDGIYKKTLIDTFKELIKFLESKNLKYFCAYGTAIGAIRHKNLIPWDDDIDLMIPREDYEKLRNLRHELPESFSIIFPEDENSTALYAKFINNRTTFWEFEQLPYVYGVFIDLFPLDEINQTVDEFVKTNRKIKRLKQLYFLSSYQFSIKYLVQDMHNSNWRMATINLLSLFVPKFMRTLILKKFNQIESTLKHSSTTVACGNYLGPYSEREYWSKNWFASSLKMPFSDLQASMPTGYDEYLKNIYGDYMKLPPIEKRVAEHNHFYINLSKKLTKAEALNRVKLGFNNEI